MKSNLERITRILQYSDCSEMQICFNRWNNSCEVYKALPDVKGGLCFMKNTKFQFEFHHLFPLINVLSQISNHEMKYITATENKKLVIGIWVVK